MNLIQIWKKFCGFPIAPIALAIFAAITMFVPVATKLINTNNDLGFWIAGLAFAGSSFACMVSLAIGIGCNYLLLLIYHMVTLGNSGIAWELYYDFFVDHVGLAAAYISGILYLSLLLTITNASEVTMLMDILHLVLWIIGINTVLFTTLTHCIG